MSRVGKQPVTIPEKVEVEIQDNTVLVKGPKGTLSWKYPAEITVKIKDHEIWVTRSGETKSQRSLHGLTRMLIANMVEGVTNGYQKSLEINGVGYSAEMKGKSLALNLGLSHQVLITPPEGINLTIPKNLVITVSGADKQLVGEIAAKIRSIAPAEPYKGKGIRYTDEKIRRKTGKKVGVK